MYKKILVPLDGSKRAERILPHVEKLAHDNDATVIFLTVTRAPRVFGYDDMQYAHFQKEIESVMGEAERKIKFHFPFGYSDLPFGYSKIGFQCLHTSFQ